MGIKQSDTSFIRKYVGGYSIDEAAWICICDFCGARAYKSGDDPGNCADNARKSGFTTVRTSVSSPSLWACNNCTDYQKEKKA